MNSKFDNTIIYVGYIGDIQTRASFNERQLKIDMDLDRFYSNDRKAYTIVPQVLKPSNIIRDIKKKLTVVELEVLKHYFKFK